MSQMNQFFTRESSNEGKRVYLSQPDGTPTEHWLHIIGADSDTFRSSQYNYNQKLRDLVGKSPEEIRVMSLDLIRGLQACLVTDWSFETECTRENVDAFFKEAPQIAEMVDRLANNRKFFLMQSTSGSTDSQKQSVSSAEGQKGQS